MSSWGWWWTQNCIPELQLCLQCWETTSLVEVFPPALHSDKCFLFSCCFSYFLGSLPLRIILRRITISSKLFPYNAYCNYSANFLTFLCNGDRFGKTEIAHLLSQYNNLSSVIFWHFLKLGHLFCLFSFGWDTVWRQSVHQACFLYQVLASQQVVCLMLSCANYSMELVLAEGWTGWSPEVPLQPLWFSDSVSFCGKFQREKPEPQNFKWEELLDVWENWQQSRQWLPCQKSQR